MFCSTWNTLGIARARELRGPWKIDPSPIFGAEHTENSAFYFQESNKTWFLFTNHIGIEDGTEYTDAIWVYWTKDINHWDASHKAVAFDGKNCSWSKSSIGMPSVLQVGDKLALFYDGNAGATGHADRDLGLAWIKLPIATPTDTAPVATPKVDAPITHKAGAKSQGTDNNGA